VLWHQPTATDLMFITLRKSEALVSPTTPATATWPSGRPSSTGRARAPHPPSGVLLLVREHRKQDGRPDGVTEPFRCLGFATDESHEGERIWFACEWRSAGDWSGRSRRRGYR